MTRETLETRRAHNADELMSAIIDLVALTDSHPDCVYINATRVNVSIEAETLTDGSIVHNLNITVTE